MEDEGQPPDIFRLSERVVFLGTEVLQLSSDVLEEKLSSRGVDVPPNI